MITGAHAILYSDDADATRATVSRCSRPSRWMPAAAGCSSRCHRPSSPSIQPRRAAGPSSISLRRRRHHRHRPQGRGGRGAWPITDRDWGLLTAIALPGGVELSLYQPKHPTAAQPS